ncbi:MAG: NAD(P)-dependent oxidoreductase [Proteobacteria bacterium]|nr:NAD(P)-dependent oxidoreductase [Pseudomonadota bacterium]
MAATVIVTGASSFVGHHLARAFAGAGHRVVATRSRPLAGYEGVRRARFAALGDGVEQIEADLRDGAALARLVAREAPGVVVHHAGYATDYASPDYDLAASLAVNVAPLVHLYRALAGSDARVIVTGSSMEYAASDSANREEDATIPDTPYGLSKLAETLAARVLALRFGVRTRVGRLYIPFGPRDQPGKLLPSVLAALRAGKPVDLSPCEQRRDFLGVADVADAWLRMAGDETGDLFEVYNVSAGEAVRLRDLLLGLARLMGADPRLLRFGARALRPGEPAVSFGANDKARTRLGWRPRPLDRALAEDLLAEEG